MWKAEKKNPKDDEVDEYSSTEESSNDYSDLPSLELLCGRCEKDRSIAYRCDKCERFEGVLNYLSDRAKKQKESNNMNLSSDANEITFDVTDVPLRRKGGAVDIKWDTKTIPQNTLREKITNLAGTIANSIKSETIEELKKLKMKEDESNQSNG